MRNANIRRGHSARSYNHSNQIGDFVSQNLWYIVGAIILIFIGIKVFGGSSDTPANQGNFLSVSAHDAKSTIYISDTDGKKSQISSSGSLYADKGSLVVESGGAIAKLGASNFDFASNSEIQYKEKKSDTGTTQDIIKVSKGIAWVDSSSENLLIELNNLSAKVPSGSIAMFEQSNSVFSSVYAIRGDIQIMTNVGQYTLTPDKKISLSSGDATNANTNLSEKANDFDSSVARMEIFIRNDGETILKASTQSLDSESENNSETQTGSLTASGSTATASGATNGKYISFTQPTDGATVKTATTTIAGILLSTEVSRITFNDTDAIISPVNESFSMENFELQNGINNIVYKVYSASGLELERGVLVVHGA